MQLNLCLLLRLSASAMAMNMKTSPEMAPAAKSMPKINEKVTNVVLTSVFC